VTTASGPFPGATAVSRLRVYDWPTADGLRGGSPHLHTASAEGYVVIGGEGAVQTLSGDGYAEHPLAEGTVLWFSPGTVHRLVNGDGRLDILVVMQNAGLPEAGDAVLTFPPEVLADADAYDRAAAAPADDDAARARRDLAVEGYLSLRERVRADGPGALEPLYRAAAALVRRRAQRWRGLWRGGALADAERTGRRLADLAAGRGDHLGTSAVQAVLAAPPPRLGMCGRLRTWDLTAPPAAPPAAS
jgi:mannose-6-phosphate isomerase-like protein (cupin superfamily)